MPAIYGKPLSNATARRVIGFQLSEAEAKLERHRELCDHLRDCDCNTGNDCGHCDVCYSRSRERDLLHDISELKRALKV